jgi:protein TonB
MAYVNQQSRQQRAPIIVATVAIQAGLIYALVHGFAVGVLPTLERPPLTGTQIELPKIKPADPPPQDRKTPQTQPRPDASGDPRPLTDTFEGVDVTDFPLGGGTGEIGIPDPLPRPTFTPKPLFTPKLARPLSAPGGWVTPDDYPSRDLRERREGSTRFSLTIGLDGLVKDCTVVTSSGSPSLDEAACAKLRKRGRFAAATDENGAAVAGSYAGAVRWKLPID